jgi:hypothetical protein
VVDEAAAFLFSRSSCLGSKRPTLNMITAMAGINQSSDSQNAERRDYQYGVGSHVPSW